jgi:hypothetical protein
VLGVEVSDDQIEAARQESADLPNTRASQGELFMSVMPVMT